MRVLNPSGLRLRETVGEFRVRLRAPLKGAGVVTRRKVLTGVTLRPTTRQTVGIFQRRGAAPMRLQALVFPKPHTAASARRKAAKMTGRKVNSCLPPSGEGRPGMESVEVLGPGGYPQSWNPRTRRAEPIDSAVASHVVVGLENAVTGSARGMGGARSWRCRMGILIGLWSARKALAESGELSTSAAAALWEFYHAKAQEWGFKG